MKKETIKGGRVTCLVRDAVRFGLLWPFAASPVLGPVLSSVRHHVGATQQPRLHPQEATADLGNNDYDDLVIPKPESEPGGSAQGQLPALRR